jgi:hypothetical protein
MEQEDKRTGAADCHGPSQKLSFLLTCAADSEHGSAYRYPRTTHISILLVPSSTNGKTAVCTIEILNKLNGVSLFGELVSSNTKFNSAIRTTEVSLSFI